MKYIVTQNIADGVQKVYPVEHNYFLHLGTSYTVLNAKIGQYFEQNQYYQLVPEPETLPNAYKMLCIGADIIVEGVSATTHKHLVLFGPEIGDLHYKISIDDDFFATQCGHELLVSYPKEPSAGNNYGFKILRNLTMDKMRQDYLAKQR